MKTSFLLSIAFGIVTVVSVFIVWTVLGAAGVWDSINATVEDVLGSEAGNFDVTDYVGTSRVLGFTMLVAVVDVVLITAIATLTAFLYNMAAALLGGVELTLAEDDCAEARTGRFGRPRRAAVVSPLGRPRLLGAAVDVPRRPRGPIAQTVRALP